MDSNCDIREKTNFFFFEDRAGVLLGNLAASKYVSDRDYIQVYTFGELKPHNSDDG